ncbi:nuclease-related domain-containing protein [Oceanobacillus sp. Castelsardo]|uniref:nuclease-related domain-containing protein n=1 Tax=Oceanobacillus sp. Castelsardo TaxID=1851204 RepID=UPI0008390EE0|nr:nuclease-related domain-containing protein [Oceanobacillus sp. Castelsardo]
MEYKSRSKPKELIVLEYLNKRMNLSNNDKQHYFNLKRGYEGELLFDSFTKKLHCDCLILNDLLLKANNTTFQIDSLIITQEKILLYEIKNFTGDHYYELDKLYKMPKFELINPLYQLGRTESLLRQLLLSHGFVNPIEAAVVFINPEFTLYQAPLHKPIIYASQLPRYFSNLNRLPSRLAGKHRMLADKLLSLHSHESPYSQLPPYYFNQLRKGITCLRCESFSVHTTGKKYTCKKCEHENNLSEAVIRNINEYTLLFPSKKLTTTNIYEWSNFICSKKVIQSILSKNYTKVGEWRWTYYK